MLAGSVISAAGGHTGVASGLGVSVGIVTHGTVVGCAPEFTKNSVRAIGMRFFPFETVAAVDPAKIAGKAKSFEDLDAHIQWFICKHGHGQIDERFESFGDSRVRAGLVQIVLAVVGEKYLKRLFALDICCHRAKSTCD